MENVFVSVGMTLNGYIAGPNGGPKQPLGEGGELIHQWMFKQKSFLEKLGMEGGVTDNPDNTIVKEIFKRAGAYIMGKKMFNEGEVNWPENPPFNAPVFVITHEERDPWERLGGTTFYFVGSAEEALKKARKAAGNKDVRVAGGAETIQEYLNLGVVDEVMIHMVPIFLNKGVQLFENLDTDKFSFETKSIIKSDEVTHLLYRVINKK